MKINMPTLEEFTQDLVNESEKNMYHEVYLLQKAGKISSTNAKKLIKDYLKDIWTGKLYVDDDGKFHDLTDPALMKELNNRLSKIKE